MLKQCAGALLLILAATTARAELAGRDIVQKAFEAAGGEGWATAETLILEGHATFYPEGKEGEGVTADDYRMWRVMDADRAYAHGPDGKVRIDSRIGDRVMFQVGYDGAVSWNQNGIVPAKEAEAYWASAFGFGIIRHALKDGFTIRRLPDDSVDGHAVHMVEITDPMGSETLFGIDQESFAIRKVGFETPKGWHERIYDDFVRLSDPDWLQARHVRLYYDGVKANEVFWTATRVNEPIADAVFELPARR